MLYRAEKLSVGTEWLAVQEEGPSPTGSPQDRHREWCFEDRYNWFLTPCEKGPSLPESCCTLATNNYSFCHGPSFYFSLYFNLLPLLLLLPSQMNWLWGTPFPYFVAIWYLYPPEQDHCINDVLKVFLKYFFSCRRTDTPPFLVHIRAI